MQAVDGGEGTQGLAQEPDLVSCPVYETVTAVVVLYHAGVAIDVVDPDVEFAHQGSVAGAEVIGEGHGMFWDESAWEEPLVDKGRAVPHYVKDESVVCIEYLCRFGVDLLTGGQDGCSASQPCNAFGSSINCSWKYTSIDVLP